MSEIAGQEHVSKSILPASTTEHKDGLKPNKVPSIKQAAEPVNE
jgi:hypothetical protein